MYTHHKIVRNDLRKVLEVKTIVYIYKILAGRHHTLLNIYNFIEYYTLSFLKTLHVITSMATSSGSVGAGGKEPGSANNSAGI